MYIDTVQSFIFHQELNLAKLMVESSDTDEEKKKKLIKWARAHEFWLFSLAGGIDSQLYAIDKGREPLESKINEFNFFDSLNKQKNEITQLYKKDAIGFIATKENVFNKEFINYVKELYKKFGKVRFKVFYFNDKEKNEIKKVLKYESDRIDFIMPLDVTDIISNIEIFISTLEASRKYRVVVNTIYKYSPNVSVNIFYEEHAYRRFIETPKDKKHKWIVNHERYGFTKEDIEVADYRPSVLFMNKLYELSGLDTKLNSSDYLHRHLNINKIEFILAKEEVKHFVNSLFSK